MTTALQLPPTRETVLLPRRTRSGRVTTRKECWQAETQDGVWRFDRLEITGTPWSVVHIPTGIELDWQSSLERCREYVATGEAQADLERLQAHGRGEHTGRVPGCRRC